MLDKLFTEGRRRLVIVLIIFFVLISPVVIYMILQLNSDTRSRAGLEDPQRVMIGNVAIDSFTVAWITPDKLTTGFISLGETQEKLDKVILDERDKAASSQRRTHITVARGLTPDKTYYFRITSGAVKFPADGQPPLSFKTPPTTAQKIPPVLNIFGEIESLPTDDAIVFLTLLDRSTEVFPLITFPSSDRTWFHNAGLIFERSLSGNASLTASTNLQIILDTGDKSDVITASTSQSPVKLTLGNDEIASLPIFTGKKPSTTPGATTPAATTTPTTSGTVVPTSSVTTTPTVTITDSVTPTPSPTGPTSLVDIIIDFFKLRQDVPLKRNDGTIVDNLPSDPLLKALRSEGFVTNVTENSFTIVWNTIQIIPGNISYGITTNLGSIQSDDRVTLSSLPSTSLHHVTIKNLTPGTKYFFRKNSSSTVESFTLPQTLASPPAFNNITGVIDGGKGECLLKAELTRGSIVSAPVTLIIDPNITWNLNLGTARKKDLSTYFSPVNSDNIAIEVLCITNESKLLKGTLNSTVENITKDPELKIKVQ